MVWILAGTGLVVPGLGMLAWGIYGDVVSREPRCRKCGFILTGISHVTACPECGKSFLGAQHPYRRVQRSMRLGFVAGGAVVLLAGLALIALGML